MNVDFQKWKKIVMWRWKNVRNGQNKFLPVEVNGEGEEGQFSQSTADTGKDHTLKNSSREGIG